MERRSQALALGIMLIFALAACSQPQTPPPTEAAASPPQTTQPEAQDDTAVSPPEPTAETGRAAEAAAAGEPTQNLEPTQTAVDQPQESPDPASLINSFMLNNMTYSSAAAAGGTAALSNGQYSEQSASDPAATMTITMDPDIAYGELDGRPVAAIVLETDPGDNHISSSLHVVGLDDEEKAVELAAAELGQDLVIDSITIAYDQVTVELVTGEPQGSSQQVVQIYELWNNGLVQKANDVVGDVAEALPSDLYYRLWSWQASLDNKTKTISAIDDPGSYSLIFKEDGTFQFTADCNRGGGTYTADDQGLIRLHLSEESLLDCGPDSQSEAMRLTLAETRLYQRDQNTLSLIRGDESITDVFADLGPVVPEEGDAAMTPEQISLSLKGVFDSWTAVEVPAVLVEPGSPPGSGGLPKHIEVYFTREDAVQGEEQSILYIIPIKEYVALWELAGDTTAQVRVDAVYDFARLLKDPLPAAGVPVLPAEEVPGVNDLATQIARTGAGLDSAAQTGYRFVGRITQESGPVINNKLRYIYQGFSNDGKYLVAFFSHIGTEELPLYSADLPQEKLDLFNQDLQRYLAGEAAALNALPPDAWQPDLASLDSLVNSLRIEGTGPSGLKNTVWSWTGHVSNPQTGEVTTNDLRGDYTAVFDDFTLTITADCAETTRAYDLLSGGMIGEIAVSAGDMSQINCGEGSYAPQFIDALQRAAEYRLLPGGTEMILALPDGEADYLLRAVDAPASDAEGASGGVEGSNPKPTDKKAAEDNDTQDAAAQPPTESAPEEEPGSVKDLFQRGFSLDVENVADSYEWQIVDAVPIGEGPNGIGFPSYVLITFDGENPQEVLENNGRHLTIYPIKRYEDLYEASGRPIISEQTGRLRQLIAAGDEESGPPTGAMPLLPAAAGTVSRWSQFQDLDFASGSGVRYLSDDPDRQLIGVWSNETTAYSYQGLTEDGRYYVSLWWPVSTDALPATADEASPELQARAADPLTNPGYVQETAGMLDTLRPFDFTPSLSLLDTMVESITIGGAADSEQ